MMNMMYNTGWGMSFTLFYGLHILSVVIFIFGAALLLLWAFKKLSENALWQWGWMLLIIGTIACLLTLSACPAFSGGMMGGWNNGLGGSWTGSPWSMMQWNTAGVSQQDSSAQSKEEADGKALYDKLRSKQAVCADLSDSDFELIGEYVMGQSLGTSHIRMNTMMQQMMGQQSEEQMHITLGRNATGCTSSQASSTSLSSGGMMRVLSSAGSSQ